jgi:hypothetical protein
MTMQTYKQADIYPDDSVDEKMKKLYVGICSVGEQLYSAGSLLSEINKKLLELEDTIAKLRKDLGLLQKHVGK